MPSNKRMLNHANYLATSYWLQQRTQHESEDRGRAGLTRKPNTGLPPGSLQTRGTTTTDVSSSHTLSMRPSSPWGISGKGICCSAPTTASLACKKLAKMGRNPDRCQLQQHALYDSILAVEDPWQECQLSTLMNMTIACDCASIQCCNGQQSETQAHDADLHSITSA